MAHVTVWTSPTSPN